MTDKEWFQHDYGTRNKRKLAVLIDEEGTRGYGLFWIIVEMLYEARVKKMELDDFTYMAIRKESKEKVEYIKQFIQKCIEVYKVFKKSGKSCFTTERVLENLKYRREISKIKSESGRKGGESKRNNLAKSKQPLAPATEIVANSSIVQESTVQEKKEEERERVEPVSQQEEGPPAPLDLSKSNLFRQPKIPTKNQVLETFITNGGSAEMAESFWKKNEGKGWYIDNSPITNYIPLAQKFIQTWKRNEQDSKTDSGPVASSNAHLTKL